MNVKSAGREKTDKNTIDVGLELLLEQSSEAIGLPSLDVIPFVVKLTEDLYCDVDSIRELTESELASFMPLRLAKQVRLELNNEFADP